MTTATFAHATRTPTAKAAEAAELREALVSADFRRAADLVDQDRDRWPTLADALDAPFGTVTMQDMLQALNHDESLDYPTDEEV